MKLAIISYVCNLRPSSALHCFPLGLEFLMHPSIKGIGLMAIAVIWFVVGWMNGVIFFYPAFLLLIGLVMAVKGVVGGGDE